MRVRINNSLVRNCILGWIKSFLKMQSFIVVFSFFLRRKGELFLAVQVGLDSFLACAARHRDKVSIVADVSFSSFRVLAVSKLLTFVVLLLLLRAYSSSLDFYGSWHP